MDWPVYNGGVDGDHYSRLTQINRGNVHRLTVAWSFDTGEKGGMQDNPLIVGRTLYAYTPTQKVVALDAATGTLKWKFDSGIARHAAGARHGLLDRRQTGAHLCRSDEFSLLPGRGDRHSRSSSLARRGAWICAKNCAGISRSSPLR